MDNNKSKQVEALDLARVKDVKKMNIKPNSILIEVVNTSKSGLLLPSGVYGSGSTSKMVVIAKGDNVTSINIGDLIIDMMQSNVEFCFKGEDKYILTEVYNILISVTPDNYIDKQ